MMLHINSIALSSNQPRLNTFILKALDILWKIKSVIQISSNLHNQNCVQMNNEVCLMLLMLKLDEGKRMMEIVQANIINLSIAANKHKINYRTVVR